MIKAFKLFPQPCFNVELTLKQNVVTNLVEVRFLGFQAEVFEATGLFNLIKQARRSIWLGHEDH
jgi:hypothetical protein